MKSLFILAKRLGFLLVLVSPLLMSSCVTGRRLVPLSVPNSAKAAETRGSVYIQEVTDARRFENSPSDPSVPSIDGDVFKLTPEVKNVMIGRQRNAWGMAMGDIALPAGSSVTETVRMLLEEAFQRHGYKVTRDPKGARAASVRVDEFWAWFTPGMWSVLFEAKIACAITVTQPSGKTLTIRGHGENSGQVASNANWQLAYARAIDQFLQNSKGELENAGF
jgi:uncharacterized lipoprotein YajG